MSQRGDPPDGDNIIPFPRSRNLGRTGTGAVGTPEERLLAAIDFGLEKFERDLDRADREAVEVESVFIRRFGFDAPRHQRARLMELKCKSDLTDREIRWLKKTGSLVFSLTEAKLSAPWWVALIGWVQIASLAVLMFLSFLLATSGAKPNAIQMLQLIAVLTVLGGLLSVSYRTYVLPRKIFNRADAFNRLHTCCPQQEEGAP